MRKFTDNKAFDPRRALSPHFRLHEFIKSATAEKYQLYNIPREEYEIANLRALATEVLEPVRCLVGVPLTITSGYRCATLNRLVGGAAQSQHMVGEAVDFIPQGGESSMDTLEAALMIAAQPDLPFDQLILETRERENAAPMRWIHISHRRFGKNRRAVLSAMHIADGRQTQSGLLGLSNLVSETEQAVA